MLYYLLKLLLSAAVIVVVSETAKRSGYWGGVIASLPLISVLAITWLYIDTHDPIKVAALARNTLWFVLPSLSFFIVLPLMLQWRRPFLMSMIVALLVTAISYVAVAALLKKLRIGID